MLTEYVFSCTGTPTIWPIALNVASTGPMPTHASIVSTPVATSFSLTVAVLATWRPIVDDCT